MAFFKITADALFPNSLLSTNLRFMATDDQNLHSSFLFSSMIYYHCSGVASEVDESTLTLPSKVFP